MSENLTTAERDGLAHWSLFGRKLTPPSQRVDGSKYKLKIFEKPVASPWYQVVPRSQLSKLLVGFAPREMEDKWIVFADGPDDVGRATVHMCRSWTGVCGFFAFRLLKLVVSFLSRGDVHKGYVPQGRTLNALLVLDIEGLTAIS